MGGAIVQISTTTTIIVQKGSTMEQQENPTKKYPNMPDQQIGTLEDLRDMVYEDHGCISHTKENRALVNLFYHFMWELTAAIGDEDGSWSEDDGFRQIHKKMMALMDYHRPNHPYSEEAPNLKH